MLAGRSEQVRSMAHTKELTVPEHKHFEKYLVVVMKCGGKWKMEAMNYTRDTDL